MVHVENAPKVRRNIKKHLEGKGIKQSWLARKVGFSTPHICNVLSGRDKFTEKLRGKINSALETNF